jgi:DNA-directed RNA polymerase specialized sigma24 family protein
LKKQPATEPRATTTPITRIPDENAILTRLFREFRPALKRRARRMTDDKDVQTDLLQEALILLWRMNPIELQQMDAETRAYVFRSLCNRMRNVWIAERGRGIVNDSAAFATRVQRDAAMADWRRRRG